MKVTKNPYTYLSPIQFLLYFLDEDLIKWGWPEDVWFHVNKVSSAHVYLRLRPVSFDPKTSHVLIFF